MTTLLDTRCRLCQREIRALVGAPMPELCRHCGEDLRPAPRHPMKTSTCKLCGRRIVWASRADGKKIPLDAIAPTYSIDGGDPPEARRAHDTFVLHHATCQEFQKQKKGQPCGYCFGRGEVFSGGAMYPCQCKRGKP